MLVILPCYAGSPVYPTHPIPTPVPRLAQAEEIFAAMDHDHSGSINFTDFVAGCLVEKQVGESALRTAFARLDHSR